MEDILASFSFSLQGHLCPHAPHTSMVKRDTSYEHFIAQSFIYYGKFFFCWASLIPCFSKLHEFCWVIKRAWGVLVGYMAQWKMCWFMAIQMMSVPGLLQVLVNGDSYQSGLFNHSFVHFLYCPKLELPFFLKLNLKQGRSFLFSLITWFDMFNIFLNKVLI